MIKHIVMFRLHDEAEGVEKKENAIAIKNLLDQLPSKISQIRDYEVGINIKKSDRASDLVLISSFDSLIDLNDYINHNEHQKALEFVNKRISEVRAIDYEL